MLISHRTRWALVAGAVAAVAIASADLIAEPRPIAAATETVEIRDNLFDPGSLTVRVGDTVEWRNAGATAHTTTRQSPPETWGSETTLLPGGRFSHTFNTVGTFSYVCLIHFGMAGTIVVTADDSTATGTAGTTTATASTTASATASTATTTATQSAGTPSATATVDRRLTPMAFLPAILNSAVGW